MVKKLMYMRHAAESFVARIEYYPGNGSVAIFRRKRVFFFQYYVVNRTVALNMEIKLLYVQ